MQTYRARRVVRADRGGSSWPVLIDTESGVFYTKLRGAAQAPLTLVAEIVVGALGPSMNFVNDEAEIADALRRINESGATVLIVGLGAPKQEIWMERYRSAMPNVRILMGVGATIDYEADAVVRAPRWMTRNGLEWLYRITTDPKRYWRRYLRDIEFFWLVLLDGIGRYRPPRLGKTDS